MNSWVPEAMPVSHLAQPWGIGVSDFKGIRQTAVLNPLYERIAPHAL